MDIKFIKCDDKKTIINFSDKVDFIDEIIVSPFRPEMFGTLIYPTLYYICNKYKIKFIMEGEANLLPLFSIYSDMGIIHNLSFYYENLDKFNKRTEVLIEHIQRDFTKKLQNDDINFGNRFSVQPTLSNGRLLNTVIKKVVKHYDIKPNDVLKDITYAQVKEFINNLYNREIYLNQNSENILDDLNLKDNSLWFVSHNRPEFKNFENYINQQIGEKVIQDTLWSEKQKIYDKILKKDINSFLSVQILASSKKNIRFVCSGGASSLFQLIPNINTIHHTIWDYYVLEFNDIKNEILNKKNMSHRVFHVGGLLNNSLKIKFSDVESQVSFMDIPHYANKLEKYDGNILNYIIEVGRSLNNQKENELNEILKLL